MTITVVARQALREGFRTKGQIEAFVTRLRSGEIAFPDEAGEGRSRSLGASLAYGFEQAFSEEERKKLALLHLFQGFVDVHVLRWMGDPETPWCLPEVRGLTLDEGIALLDRAAEVGLLTALGGGYYGIHPALPWFFKGLFERCYQAEGLAVRAFVEADALDLLPVDAVNALAVTHNQLGSIYSDKGDLDRAVHHHREALQLCEQAGNFYGAAQARGNVAIDLYQAGRRADALEYAEAALRGFEPYGAGAAEDIEHTRRLIAKIRGV